MQPWSYPMSSNLRWLQPRLLAIFALLILLLLMAGCSVNGVSGLGQSSREKQVEPVSAEVDIPRPAKPAKVATDDELGFTITESVRISGEVRDAYAMALQLLENDNTEAGIAALQTVVELAPELTAPHIDLGIAYSKSGDYEKAEASLKRALLLTPDHPVAHNELGIVYRKTGRFQLARQSYEEALAILEDFHYAQRNLGVLCDLFLEDLSCALANYEAYQRAFPDDQEVQIWVADIRNRLGTP